MDEIDEKWKLSLDISRNIYLIFKEVINNLAKYSRAKNVTLSIKQKGNFLHCKIEDDGIGFATLYLIKNGNGLLNMKKRGQMLNANFDIKTDDKGTVVTLILKI